MKLELALVLGCGVLASAAAIAATAVSATISLPADTSQLKKSDLAGYRIARQKCGICHSADYVNLQPPGMTTQQWAAEMAKMQHTYGAPLTESDIDLLGEYLGVTYGGQPPSAAAGQSAQPTREQTTHAAAGDATSRLSANACLSCHAMNTRVVGPAYKEVAARYRNDPHALAKVEASIHDGGHGKWGDVAMPPFDHLSAVDLKTLAEYVLRQ
jgi:cytochrome c551/c552